MANPATRAAAAAGSAWCGAISSTSAAPGASQVGADTSSSSIASRPVGPLTSAPVRFVARDLGRQRVELVRGHVGRVRDGERQRARERVRKCAEPRALGEPHPRRAASRDVRGRDRERVGARVGRPHLGRTELRFQRERDRARTGAEIGDDRGRRGVVRVARTAPDAEPCRFFERDLDDPFGLGPGISTRWSTIRSRPRKLHEPSTYCSGSPASRRATIASRWACARSFGPCAAIESHSAPSYPDAVSVSQRASAAGDSIPASVSRSATMRRCWAQLARAAVTPRRAAAAARRP